MSYLWRISISGYMIKQVTDGIAVSVSVAWLAEQSNVAKSQFWFQYRIELENLLSVPCQLLRRQWYIFDSAGIMSDVEGEGVVGVQPILRPGDSYSYYSGVPLVSDIGKMSGFYTFLNLNTGLSFQVAIPTFELVYPAKLN